MNYYSQDDLNAKIQTFMAHKIKQYPELADERYIIEPVQTTEPDRTTRGQLFSFMRTSAQY